MRTKDDPSSSISTQILNRLKIVEVDKIEPHEEYIEKLLGKIKKKILDDRVFKDPILADYSNGLVIDGTHRLLAMRELEYRYIPIIDFNYLHDNIRLGRWFRIIKKNQDDIFQKISKILKLEKIDNKNKFPKYLNENPLTIFFRNKTYIYSRGEWYNSLRKVDSIIKDVEIEFIEDDRIDEFYDKNYLIIGYKSISRKEILNIFKSHTKLSYKSTRHIPPFRIVNINLPLSLLNNISKAESYLSTLELEYLGKNIYYEGRIYKEKVYIARSGSRDII